MRSIRFIPFCLVAALFAAAAFTCRADTAVETMRRLYDFTPVGPNNPVLAKVPDYGIEIPVSEFRAYVAGEVADAATRAALPPAQRRHYLEALLDEHFLLANGYEQKADQTEGVAGMLKTTKAMLLEEAVTDQELKAPGNASKDRDEVLNKFRDRLFGQMDIVVSNEAYAKLKAEAHRLNAATGALTLLGKSAAPNSAGATPQVSPDVAEVPLAHCKLGVITIGDVLHTYLRQPLPERPDLDQQDGVIAVLKHMLGPDLMVGEARARGLEKSPMVREKMQLNRNVLTRLYALDQLTAQATAQMKSPDIDARLKEWYQANLKKLYTFPDKDGKEQVLPFDGNRERIADDYFQNLQDRLRADLIRTLREKHKIEIDDAALAKAAL
ncbi:MAG TPA: hypothetical protein VFB27_13325 [Opitutaceae bacterium]|nr:hypothetical protein [Opitutaceae bacterium]